MQRIKSVDLFRIISIIAVIGIHADGFGGNPFAGETALERLFDVIIDQGARFAVPFFFIISGYFWGGKVHTGAPALPMALKTGKRVAMCFGFWCLVYALPYNVGAFFTDGPMGPILEWQARMGALLDDPVNSLLQGTRVHLWFLMALGVSAVVCGAFLQFQLRIPLYVVATALYVVGMMGSGYKDTPFGLDLGVDTRNGPFFSTIMFATGYVLAGVKRSRVWFSQGALLFLGGMLLHFGEIYLLWVNYGTIPMIDYGMGTYFMGLGISMVALSDVVNVDREFIYRIGFLTLGVYGVHYMFLDILKPLHHAISAQVWEQGVLLSWVWELGYILFIYSVAVFASGLIAKSDRLRRFVL